MKYFILFSLFFSSFSFSSDLEPTDKEKNVIIEVVKESLKDPYSAKFKDIKKSGISFCGKVNSKNSFGGYGGFKGFHGVYLEYTDGKPPSALIFDIAEDEMSTRLVFETCSEKGLL
jgi:hypothetical protein